MTARLEQLRVANELLHAENLRLLRDAEVGHICREELKKRGCVSEDDNVVHVPTLIADFLDAKDAEIKGLRDRLYKDGAIPEEPKTEACPLNQSEQAPDLFLNLARANAELGTATVELMLKLRQSEQRRDNHDDLSGSWLRQENHQLNARIDRLINFLGVAATATK